ncbi:hypothetical protein ACSSS7_004716 [Eimeria intestinalis]
MAAPREGAARQQTEWLGAAEERKLFAAETMAACMHWPPGYSLSSADWSTEAFDSFQRPVTPRPERRTPAVSEAAALPVPSSSSCFPLKSQLEENVGLFSAEVFPSRLQNWKSTGGAPAERGPLQGAPHQHYPQPFQQLRLQDRRQPQQQPMLQPAAAAAAAARRRQQSTFSSSEPVMGAEASATQWAQQRLSSSSRGRRRSGRGGLRSRALQGRLAESVGGDRLRQPKAFDSPNALAAAGGAAAAAEGMPDVSPQSFQQLLQQQRDALQQQFEGVEKLRLQLEGLEAALRSLQLQGSGQQQQQPCSLAAAAEQQQDGLAASISLDPEEDDAESQCWSLDPRDYKHLPAELLDWIPPAGLPSGRFEEALRLLRANKRGGLRLQAAASLAAGCWLVRGGGLLVQFTLITSRSHVGSALIQNSEPSFAALLQHMEQLLPLPFIEAPASAKLSVLHPCTPRAGDVRVSAPGAPACEVKEGLILANVEGGPGRGWEGGPLSDLASRKRKERLRVGPPEAWGFSAEGRGPLRARLEGAPLPTTPNHMHGSALQQPQKPQRTGAARASGSEASAIVASRGGLCGTQEDTLSEWRASPLASLKLGVFRCLQDLRAEGEGPPGGGPQDRGPGCFSSHVLNVLDACEVADLELYLQIFSVCLRRGAPPRHLSTSARGLMLEALEALEVSGFSVHARAVCKQYHRVIRTLRRRDALFPAFTSRSSSSSSGSSSSSSSNSSSSSSSDSMGSGRRDVLQLAAAAAGREDAELADLWVNASLEDPEAEEDRFMRPHAEACRGIERSHEFLLHCKHTILRQLRALKRLAPVWAARERAYEYHFEAVMGARCPSELSVYLIIFAGLEADPDGKHVVSISSLLGCLRELRLLQCSNPQEAAAVLAPPVTQAELSHCLAASSAKRGLAAAGLGGGPPHSARKTSGRCAAAAATPALATRAQKHRVMSPQLEAEVSFNLMRLAGERQGTAVSAGSLFASAATSRDVRPWDTDPSLIYAEELLAVAAGDDPNSSVTAQQAACGELQRLLQYWEEGVFPAVSRKDTRATPTIPPSPQENISSSSVQLKQPPLWRLTRTRSSPPCTVGGAAATTAAAFAAATGESARCGPTPAAAIHPHFKGGPLGGDSDRLLLSRLQQRLSPIGRLAQATQSRGVA